MKKFVRGIVTIFWGTCDFVVDFVAGLFPTAALFFRAVSPPKAALSPGQVLGYNHAD